MKRHGGLVLLLTAWVALVPTLAVASGEDDDYTRMARLSYIEGNVGFQHASDADWSAASVNMPLEPWDRIYTGPGGRAEIEFDDGSVYRLAENTDVEILALREDLIQLRILTGLSTLTVSSSLDFEINTPAAAFNAARKGVYRFHVDEKGDTEAVVRKGELETAGDGFSRRVEAGEIFRVSPGAGGGSLVRYDRRDAWDEWNDRRNADRQVYASGSRIPAGVFIGVAELGRYGRWVDVGAYGWGWVPFYTDAYWAPYSWGRWCYRPLFGWTWISYEPWGWLPYHYGRWHRHARYGWCWLPGPGFSFNFWAPALVTFYYGPGWISWCPLGPGDYYNIGLYRFNRRIHGYQLERLRALHHRPPGDPINRHVPGAFRTADIERFRSGSFDPRDRRTPFLQNVDQPWKSGALVQDRLKIQPEPASYRPAPERPVVRPSVANALPAVVRTSPGGATENRGGFNRITTPRLPAVEPATPRIGLNDRADRRQADPENAGNRIIRVTGAEHVYRSEPDARAGRDTDAPVRTIREPRAAGARTNDAGDTVGRWRAVQTERPEAAPPTGVTDPTPTRVDRVAPERIQAPRAPAVGEPATSFRPRGGEAFPRAGASNAGRYSGVGPSRPAPQDRSVDDGAPPRSFDTRTGGAPIRSFDAPSGGRVGGVTRTFSAPSAGGVTRSYSAPSAGRAAGNAGSPSTGRTGGGLSPGRPSGIGGPAGRNQR